MNRSLMINCSFKEHGSRLMDEGPSWALGPPLGGGGGWGGGVAAPGPKPGPRDVSLEPLIIDTQLFQSLII